MIKFTNTEVMNTENAIRGMRNPLDSWHRADSNWETQTLGPNDLDLAKRLINAGPTHRKFMRQILVSVDIEAPLYWWKEMDQYKVGTTTNSRSTMHTLHKTPITPALFSVEDLSKERMFQFQNYCTHMEILRQKFVQNQDKSAWRELIQMLPSSFNQMRTITLNYEILTNIYETRKNHKLTEWRKLCDWIETLPNSELITFTSKKQAEKGMEK